MNKVSGGYFDQPSQSKKCSPMTVPVSQLEYVWAPSCFSDNLLL
jgi:hypothetical protein